MKQPGFVVKVTESELKSCSLDFEVRVATYVVSGFRSLKRTLLEPAGWVTLWY